MRMFSSRNKLTCKALLTEQLLGFSVLQCLADFVLLLLDRKLVVTLQLDFTHSTAFGKHHAEVNDGGNPRLTLYSQVGSSQIECQEGTVARRWYKVRNGSSLPSRYYAALRSSFNLFPDCTILVTQPILHETHPTSVPFGTFKQ